MAKQKIKDAGISIQSTDSVFIKYKKNDYTLDPFLLTYLASHLGECDTVGDNDAASGYANYVSFTNKREKYKPATTVMVEQNVVRIWEDMLLEDEVYSIVGYCAYQGYRWNIERRFHDG